MQDYLTTLIQTYHAQLAGAYIGDETETLDKIQEICDNLNLDVEEVMFDYEHGTEPNDI